MKGKEKVEKSDYGLGLAISSVPDFLPYTCTIY